MREGYIRTFPQRHSENGGLSTDYHENARRYGNGVMEKICEGYHMHLKLGFVIGCKITTFLQILQYAF